MRRTVTLALLAALAAGGCHAAGPAGTTGAQPAPSDSGPPRQEVHTYAPVTLNSDGASPGGANTAGVVAALTALLATLDPAKRDAITYEFTDSRNRRTWSHHPVTAVPRPGVALDDLDAPQRAAALKVLRAALSEQGFAQVEAIRKVGRHLARTNREPGAGTFHLAVYGTPSPDRPFMVQLGGLHLARNLTYHGDRVSQTPSFTGAEPVTFTEARGKPAIEPMKAEAAAILAVLAGLSPEERTAARLSTGTYDDLLMGPGQDAGDFGEAQGLLVSELSVRDRVTAAIDAHVGDLDDTAAARLLAKYQSEYPRTRLSWAGDAAEATYVRIDGPSVWIEFLTTADHDGTGGVHHHSVHRDKTNDYGSA